MADNVRTVQVVLDMLVDRYQRAAAFAATATRDVTREIRLLGTTSVEQARILQPLGTAGLALGGAFAAGGVLAGRAAISWESAFAGVRKTVDGTETELTGLSDELRDLAAHDLPATREEIAAVAEAAGQLGVATGNVAEFTEVMVNLGETTNLTSTMAADSLARLANVTQMPQSEFDRLGSTVVALGNGLAATELDLVSMGQRIAAAGTIVGLSEADILGFAGALSSVGIEAEAGGTAISKTFIEIASAVDMGGEKLEKIAGVAGMSGTTFRTAFEDDAAGAVISFVEGLGLLESRGQSVFQVLDDLGLSEVRLRNALLSASTAGDLLRESVDLGSRAWEENTALTEEAEKRYQTTAAQMEIFWNNLTDLAVDAGSVALPILNDFIGGADMLVDGLREMPGPLKAAAGGLALITGGTAVLGGGFLFLLPRIRETAAAWDALSKRAPRLAGGLTTAGKAAGIVGAALTAGTVIYGLYAREKERAKQVTADFVAALREEKEGIDDAVDALIAKKIVDNDLDTLAQRAGVSIDTVTRAILGEKDAVDEIAAAGIRGAQIRDREGVAAAELWQKVKDLTAAHAAAQSETDRLATQEERLGVATGDATTEIVDQTSAAEDAAAAIDEYVDALDRLYAEEFAVEEVLGRLHGDLLDFADGVRAAQIEGDRFAASLDGTTIEGLRNQDMLRRMVDGAFDVAAAMREQGASNEAVAATMAGVRDQLVWTLVQLGFNETKVREYTDVLLRVPGHVDTTVTVDTSQAEMALQRLLVLFAQVGQMGRDVRARIEAGGGSMSAFGSQVPVLGPSFGTGLADVVAGRGPAATAARESASSSARNAADEAEQERRRWLQQQDDFERNLFDHSMRSLEQYTAYLEQRMSQERIHSSEWFALLDERERVAREHADALNAIWDAQLNVQRIQFDEGRLTSDQMISVLMDAHARAQQLHGYWSAEAHAIRNEIRGIREAETRAAEERAREAERAADEAERARKDRLDRLNRLLEAEHDIRKRMEALNAEHHQRLSDLDARYNDDLERLLADRHDTLMGWADANERFVAGWGNTVSAITGNLAQQAAAFDEWSDALADARSRGVSDAVIDMLGLAEGPQALAQLRMFASATQEEIDALNEAVADRAAQTAEQVASEQVDTSSELGRQLIALAEQHAAAVEAETEQFLSDMRDMRDELEALGFDQGLKYGSAIEQGLRSTLAGVRAAAIELQQAMRGSAGDGGAANADVGFGVDERTGRPILNEQQAENARRRQEAAARLASVSGGSGSALQMPSVSFQPNFDVIIDGKRVIDDRVKVQVAETRKTARTTSTIAGKR